ncbi:MAG: DUF4870 domain-containing protein [Bacteroidales bacterium]|nr:DUF4870 domain-containing protein [Bacteroidales bacterium]MCF8333944.1 DUF4870 domain-containing protein [Bacteroidales bacterium]
MQYNFNLPKTTEEKKWAMLVHFSALSGLFIPFGNLLGPLVVWLLKKDQSVFVDDQGKEALNFQLSMLIYSLISGLLIIVGIGIVLLVIIGILVLVLSVLAGIKANEGVYYRYPFTFRLIQ